MAADDVVYEYFATAACIFILYLVIRIFLNAKPCDTDDTDDTPLGGAKQRSQFSACQSPVCARCQNYRHLRENARALLGDVRAEKRSELQRIFAALEVEPMACDASGRQKPNVLYIEGLSAEPWWSRASFVRDVRAIECSFKLILRDYRRISAGNQLYSGQGGWTRNSSETGVWYTYYVINQGCWVDENAARCPAVVDLVERSLNSCMFNCVFGNVFLSVMEPGTTVEPHYGPCNARIRCHLGLRCPTGWQITVAGVSARWQEGSCLLFDDSFLHHVSHTCPEQHVRLDEANDESRAVLIIDLWHPELTEAERDAICEVFSL